MYIFPEGNPVFQEYEKIKKIAEALCTSEPGRLLLKNIPISTDYTEILSLLSQTKEFKKIIENGEPFPVEGITDITKEIQLLHIINSVLTCQAFLNILNFLKGTKGILNFFEKRKMQYQLFSEMTSNLIFNNDLIHKIEEIIDESGVVKTSASSDLARIRKVLAKKRNEAEKLFQTILFRLKKNGWVGESEESMRNGRRVIMIIAEQKRTIKGIVHDISTSGKNVFIEPEETIRINNDLYELEQEEKREIIRILKNLTSSFRPSLNHLKQYAAYIAVCDFTMAKASFAISTKSQLPHVVKHAHIDLKNARHPLLFIFNNAQQKPTIPFSLRLDKNRILVISGPNAGGKTVCMKTIGLLQLMLQSGFLVPAEDTSTMGIFEKIMVDLGDSQSLEYELSTYSSRLSYMKTFIEACNTQSLFLIDEFGTGTDPNLGGALAEAILEELNLKGGFGVITTHYLNLKLLAEKTPGIINGSMAFAPDELKPLYHLIIGKPGSSFTFIVAERSGLSKKIIEAATLKIDQKSYALENLLTKIENEKNLLNEKLKSNAVNEKRLSELIKKYNHLLAEAEKTKTTFDLRFKEKEIRLVNDLNKMFKGFMKEWKSTKSKKLLVERFSKQLEIKYNKLLPDKQSNKVASIPAFDISLFKPGTLVTLNGGKTKGKIESIDGNKAKVLFGDFYTFCSIHDLVPIETT